MDLKETEDLTEGELLDVEQSTDEVIQEDVSYQEYYLDMEEAVDLTEGELLDIQQSTEEISDEDVSDEPTPSPDLGWVDALHDEEDSDADEPSFVASLPKSSSCAETARMFKLRRGLDQLDCIYQQKEHDMQKAREELIQCRQNIADLTKERSQIEQEIEQKRKTFNATAVFRLRVKLRKLCLNLQREEELQGEINTKLQQQEVEMSKMELGMNKISMVRRQVEEQEQNFHTLRAQKAATRLELQKKVSKNLQHQIKMQKQHKQQAALTLEDECRKRAESHQANRKIAVMYLKETTKRIHQQEAEKEQQSRELLEKRIQAVTSLKSNIAATQAGFRVQQRKAKENVQKKEQQERQLRESLQARGIDGIRQIYQQRRDEEIKEKQEEFARRLKSKRNESAARILQEEQLVKSRKRQQAPIPPANRRLSSLRRAKDKLLNYLDHGHASASEERAALYRELTGSRSSSAASSVVDLEEAALDRRDLTEYLAEPEFSGLWEQEDQQKAVDRKTTLAQSEVRQEAAEVAAEVLTRPEKRSHGKKTRKASFICKPPVIHFKDFEVGKIYKKKVVLTNTSYATNSCRFLGVSAHLKDLVSINFEHPGFLSTGMSCEMQTIFQPKTNEDLEGEVRFTSVVGPFAVPFRCTIKKCDLEVESQLIDFGMHVVGQTISRTITLTNKGALATRFSLDTSEGLSAESGQVQMSSQQLAAEVQEESSDGVTSDQNNTAPVVPQELQSERDNQESFDEPQQDITKSSGSVVECDPKPPADPLQSYQDSGDIRLGKVRSGEIGPFESVKLEIVFTPTIPGEAKLNFHLKFSDAACKPIPIRVVAGAVSTPVWVVRPTVDLKICMYDCLYQDSIAIQSRASTALKLTFEVCPEMRKHMEILPKMGFIQAHSNFNVQLKFLPRPSLPKDAKKFFDSDTKVLEVPLTVQVAGQVKPVNFTVQAIVTSSDLQFDQTEVDFGYCSVYQSVRCSVLLANLSLLPQDFGFVSVPEYVEVQPGDGFGTLLPQESLKIDLIFSANKAKEYRFQLCCKTKTDRDFHLPCRAVGVRPPLELSHSLVKFGPTAIGDHSTALLYLSNRETGPDSSNQPRALATKGTATPAAPRLFSFKPPRDGAISITPLAGSLKPGERCIVLLTFRPVLPDEAIRDEALRLAQKAKLLREQERERKRLAELEAKKEAPVETKKGKKKAATPNKVAIEQQMEEPIKSPSPENIQPGSQLYEEAAVSLLHSLPRRFTELLVPCYVSDGNTPAAGQLQPPWSPFNTLHLKVQCSTVRPPLVIVSNSSVVDFQQVAIGEKSVKNLTIQNISRGSLDLKSSVLDTHGVFCIMNAFRCLSPGEKHTLILAFCPSAEKKYCETLELRSQKMNLEVTLCGEGVHQAVSCSHLGDLDFGYVLPKDRTSQVFQDFSIRPWIHTAQKIKLSTFLSHTTLRNNSALAVDFSAQLASLRPPRPQDDADWVALLLGDPRAPPIVGTQNYSGMSVFTVSPAEGSIAAGECQDVTVTFQPDHQSANYSDRLTVELSNKSKVCVMDLRGVATSQSLYLHGGDSLRTPVESLLPPVTTWLPQPSEVDVKEKSFTVLVTLQASCSTGVITPAVRQLQVGCVNQTPPSKKNVDFLWDSTECLPHGFSIEPCKGTFEPGSKETISITWTPTSDFKPFDVVQTCASVTLKWEDTCVFRVTLIAAVSSAN